MVIQTKKKMKVQFKDIVYSDSHNPENVNTRKRHYMYIIDGDGKERLCIEEENYTNEENEEKQ